MEEVVGFHAVATTAALFNNLLEENPWLDTYCTMPRVMLCHILPGHMGQLMLLKQVQIGQFFLIRKNRGIIYSLLLRQGYPLEICL